MKYGQLIEYNVRKMRQKIQAQRLVPDLFLFFKKALYEVKTNGQHLSFKIFF